MPRPDAAPVRAVDGASRAGADSQEARQDARPFDDAALPEALGLHRAKATHPGDTARSAQDRGVAASRIIRRSRRERSARGR